MEEFRHIAVLHCGDCNSSENMEVGVELAPLAVLVRCTSCALLVITIPLAELPESLRETMS